MAVQIVIVGREDASSHTMYNIRVQDGRQGWMVARRYREFRQLDSQLASIAKFSQRTLPAKAFLGFRNRFDISNFKEKRQTGLQEYLSHLAGQVQDLSECPVLATWLEALPREHIRQEQVSAQPASVSPARLATCTDLQKSVSMKSLTRSLGTPVMEQRAPNADEDDAGLGAAESVVASATTSRTLSVHTPPSTRADTISDKFQGLVDDCNGALSSYKLQDRSQDPRDQGPEVYDMGGQDSDADESTRDEIDHEAIFFGTPVQDQIHDATNSSDHELDFRSVLCMMDQEGQELKKRVSRLEDEIGQMRSQLALLMMGISVQSHEDAISPCSSLANSTEACSVWHASPLRKTAPISGYVQADI